MPKSGVQNGRAPCRALAAAKTRRRRVVARSWPRPTIAQIWGRSEQFGWPRRPRPVFPVPPEHRRLISFTSIRAKVEVRGGGWGCVRAERPQTDRQARSAPRSRRASERAANAFSDRSTFLSAPRNGRGRSWQISRLVVESKLSKSYFHTYFFHSHTHTHTHTHPLDSHTWGEEEHPGHAHLFCARVVGSGGALGFISSGLVDVDPF